MVFFGLLTLFILVVLYIFKRLIFGTLNLLSRIIICVILYYVLAHFGFVEFVLIDGILFGVAFWCGEQIFGWIIEKRQKTTKKDG